MLARTYTATLQGLNPTKIEVEVDTVRGQPKLIFIGLPTRTVAEAKERITAAVSSCGIRIKSRKTIVNLAPADLKKTASCIELPIAIALLKQYGEIRLDSDKTMFFGEFSLNGELKPLKHALALVCAAKTMGFKEVVVPASSVQQLKYISGIEIKYIEHLRDYLEFAQKHKPLSFLQTKKFIHKSKNREHSVSITDILGQEVAKRALVIAAAGRHHLLLTGPPGAGKSLLAQSLNSILPPLSSQEAMEVAMVYSAAGIERNFSSSRPFRSPHHTASILGLLGGGTQIKPGEISLAHCGVLFLDELNLFNKATLEALREPLEKGSVTLTKNQGSIRFPARFSFVAATNPCPCGFAQSSYRSCTCTPDQIKRYKSKLSGPLKDRIDLSLTVLPAAHSKLSARSDTESLEIIQAQVLAAQKKQADRFANTTVQNNGRLTSKLIREHCVLEPMAQKLLSTAAERLALSSRGYFSIIRIAQTIADLEAAPKINADHIAEALQFRPNYTTN